MLQIARDRRPAMRVPVHSFVSVFSNRLGKRALLSSIIAAVTCVVLQAPMIRPADAFNRLPECTAHSVLNKVVRRFNQTERIYWRGRDHSMQKIIKPHLHTRDPFPDSAINRNYCHGEAVFADGKKRRILYLIEQRAGFAGASWNVEYCVRGLDPWYYYNGRCRVLNR